LIFVLGWYRTSNRIKLKRKAKKIVKFCTKSRKKKGETFVSIFELFYLDVALGRRRGF